MVLDFLTVRRWFPHLCLWITGSASRRSQIRPALAGDPICLLGSTWHIKISCQPGNDYLLEDQWIGPHPDLSS